MGSTILTVGRLVIFYLTILKAQNKYLYLVKDMLHNPVYNALLTGEQYHSFGTERVKYFNEEVSPFVGFDESNTNGFAELHEILPAHRRILYATTNTITPPTGWQLQHEIKGLQFVYENEKDIEGDFSNVIQLNETHIDQMIHLTAVTKPGPFGKKTIDFGHYYGIFEDEKLVAMTGQRLHVENFTEISAVCTLPVYTGKGYAYRLLLHQVQLILEQGQQPFLHVKDNNERAIALYKRIGFAISRQMIFYFLKKE